MKSFVVVYTQTTKRDQLIQARNEKEALEKFKQERPEVKVVEVQKWDEGFHNYD